MAKMGYHAHALLFGTSSSSYLTACVMYLEGFQPLCVFRHAGLQIQRIINDMPALVMSHYFISALKIRRRLQ